MKRSIIPIKSDSSLSAITGLVLIISLMTANSTLSGQNIGIGTTTPGQKLEVNGNIKLGDNIMVEGNENLKVYRNLASFISAGSSPGAYVIHSNQPVSGTQYSIKIEGYFYSPVHLFKIIISGYDLIPAKTGFMYEGEDKLTVQVGSESNNYVFILGESSATYTFVQLSVTEFQVCFANTDETYADGWSITRETNLTPYAAFSANEKSYLQWNEDGPDIYRSSGNVGIGTSSPGSPFEIVYTDDSHSSNGIHVVNQSTSSSGETISAIKAEIFSTSSDNTRGAVYGVHNNTSGTASGVYGWTGSTGGYGVTGRNGAANRVGYLGTEDYGVYGNSIWSTASGNYGYLGSDSYGAYGKHYSTDNFGYLGGTTYGAFGRRNTDGNFGALGTLDYGVYGSLAKSSPDDGEYAIYGYGVRTLDNPQGSGYGGSESIGAVKGYNLYGNAYTYAVSGYTWLDNDRAGGCFGATQTGGVWGCLSYRTSGSTNYGGYFTSYSSGTGEASNSHGLHKNNGIGVYGDLFGADIHGEIYGIFTEGSHYGLFANGHVIKNKLDVHLQEGVDHTNTALYTHVSTDVTVQTSGYGQLSNGRCSIAFDENFKNIASDEVPIVVTVTPVGDCQGIYLDGINSDGFSVREINAGRSQVAFSYIAIARRQGYENPQLPEEVTSPDYLEKLSRGLHNDSDTESDGEGLYFKDGTLTVGKIAEEPVAREVPAEADNW